MKTRVSEDRPDRGHDLVSREAAYNIIYNINMQYINAEEVRQEAIPDIICAL